MHSSIKIAAAIGCFVLAVPTTATEASDLNTSAIADYLAARSASFNGDFDIAAELLAGVAESHQDSPLLLNQYLYAAIGSGDRDRAFSIARDLEAMGKIENELVVSTLAAADFHDGRFDRAYDRYQTSTIKIVPAYETILQGWSHHVEQNYASADQTFLGHDPEDRLLPHVQFQHSLSLALRGHLEEADRTVGSFIDRSLTDGGIPISLLRDLQYARIQILAAKGQVEDARVMSGLFEAADSGLPAEGIRRLRERIEGSETFEFDFVRSPSEAMALFIADVSRGVAESGEPYQLYQSLLYARLASFLMPNNTMRMLEVAQSFKDIEAWRMAEIAYRTIPESDPHYGMAVIGRADALYRGDRVEDALSSLRDLVASRPSDSGAQMALGDLLRMEKDYAASLPYYDRAIELMESERQDLANLTGRPALPIDWVPHHFRAIALERVGEWEAAKSEFHRALQMSDNNPYVLNYLGYTLADRNEELEVARDLIAQAVEQMPDNGAFLDSLGWVHYRMQNFEEAVEQLEKAIREEPQDPVILDHLGDVYWRVGRRKEARFQWQQSLTYDSEWTDKSLIARKLEVGLDEALSE